MHEELEDMKKEAEDIGGRVTPFGFEQALNERFRITNTEYQQFIKDAKSDARLAEKERDKLEREYTIEKNHTHDLEVSVNEA